jgi:serine/threonine protein kinase
VADFNLSKIFGAANETDGPSNPMWLAPEVALEDAEATEASDVYSFALVLYELLTWQLPWEGRGPIQVGRHRGLEGTAAAAGALVHQSPVPAVPPGLRSGSAAAAAFPSRC